VATNIPDGTNPEADLLYTRSLRVGFVQALAPNGTLPADVENIQTVVGLLNDIDRQALGRMRIKTDESAGNSALMAQQTILRLLGEPIVRTIGLADKPVERELPGLEGEGSVRILDGEMATGGTQENYHSFAARLNQAS